MSARKHVNPNQLQLFVDPEEHIANIKSSTDMLGYHGGDVANVWAEKEDEARSRSSGHGGGIYQSLKRGEQLRKPAQVILDTEGDFPTHQEGPMQWEGHHRVAAAAAVQRENKAAGKPNPHVYVPVEYVAGRGGAFKAQYRTSWRQREYSD